MCQGLVVVDQTMEPSDMEIEQIGIDTSKHVFTLHGVDASGAAVVQRDLRRSAFEAYMAKLAPTAVALEACGVPTIGRGG